MQTVSGLHIPKPENGKQEMKTASKAKDRTTKKKISRNQKIMNVTSEMHHLPRTHTALFRERMIETSGSNHLKFIGGVARMLLMPKL